MMKFKIERNILRKYLLMIAVLLLFFAGGFRAFTLYKTYRSYETEIESIQRNVDKNIHNVLRVVIEEAHDIISYKTKMDSITLHRTLIESMTVENMYDNIVNMNLDNEFIKILDKVFDLTNEEDKVIITVGTKDYVFYCKSNIQADKYDHLDVNKKFIKWDEYYTYMDNPEVVQMAYEDLVLQRTDYVILHVDGYYPEGRYYTMDDIVQEYHKNGTKNLHKFYMLTVGVITDTGDIFGESDDIYLQHNPNVHKIYIFKAVSLEGFVDEYQPILATLDESMSAKIIQVRNNTEFGNALVNIFLITTSIITLMIVIKSLDDENLSIENKNGNSE